MHLHELFQIILEAPASTAVAGVCLVALLVAWKALDVALHAIKIRDR